MIINNTTTDIYWTHYINSLIQPHQTQLYRRGNWNLRMLSNLLRVLMSICGVSTWQWSFDSRGLLIISVTCCSTTEAISVSQAKMYSCKHGHNILLPLAHPRGLYNCQMNFLVPPLPSERKTILSCRIWEWTGSGSGEGLKESTKPYSELQNKG